MALGAALSALGAGVASQAKTAAGHIEKAKLIIRGTTSNAAISSVSPTAGAKNALAAAQQAAVPGSGTHILEVQYNPDSLSIQATAEPVRFTYLQQNVDSNIPHQNVRPPMMMLSVELIFDHVNPQEAFMFDKAKLSVASFVSDAAALKTTYTVQPQTNGILAAALRKETRTVIFCWGNLSFEGEIYEAQAQYTMFSPSGRPIRSVVHLNLAQSIDDSKSASQWDSLVDNVFKAPQTPSENTPPTPPPSRVPPTPPPPLVP